MGRAVELLTGFVTAPGTTLTALTMAAGNSLQVRAAKPETPIWLMNAWVDNQTDGILRVRSPTLHDNVQGIRLGINAGIPQPLLPKRTMQKLTQQDTLTVELSGSATAGDIETACLLLYYDDISGIDGKFIGIQELQARIRNIVTVENTLAAGTAGGYSGEENLSTESDLLRPGSDYALIGAVIRDECACVRWRGTDFGNLGVGMPGDSDNPGFTKSFFADQARQSGLDTIPVFLGANSGAVLIDCAQDENGTDVLVSTILAELAPA